MKHIFFALFILSGLTAQAQQAIGTMRIYAFCNTDNKLAHNQELKNIHLCIIGPHKDTLVNDTVDLKFQLNSLKPGKYGVIARYGTYEPIVLTAITVSADRITFIDLLFEPKKKHRKKIRHR